MQSYEALRRSIDPVGVKAVAHRLGVSAALVYKWCQPPESEEPQSGGARNPLDRLQLILKISPDRSIVHWLCHEADGFFVPNPQVSPGRPDATLLARTQQLVQEFSDLLRTVTQAIEDDGKIKPHEAERIRAAWEMLKSSCECFASACEVGHFGRGA